ncbi:M20/M25/M40 family metallo-hydrolase [Candidatus Carsonella ruddii]|uniref:M20/M25/M40 family metallo-hydrolase n=1 Tax=Carsonella ruddii TaxID=114186 RepID=UPI003D3AA2F5
MLIFFFYFLKFFLIKKTYSYCKEYFFFEIIKYIKIHNFEIIKNRNVINLILFNKNNNNIFISHLDIVNEGYIKWIKPIFTCICYKKKIFCRGVIDMKGGYCSFFYLSKKNNFILTNDEENLSIYGVQYVINIFQKRKIKINLFYSGEPTSKKIIGDNIKISRRGSYNFLLIFIGKQKHCAYIGKNIIKYSIKKILKLLKNKIDKKEIFSINNNFSVSSLDNLTPNNYFIKINYRFLEYKNILNFKKKIFLILIKKKNYFKWIFSGVPFFCYKNHYLTFLFDTIFYIQKIYSKINFFGGTSDLRYCYYFYKKSNFFELGLINKTIHKINEFSNIDNIYILYLIYKFFNNGIK